MALKMINSYPVNMLKDIDISKEVARNRVGKLALRIIHANKKFQLVESKIRGAGLALTPFENIKKGELIFGSERVLKTS